VAENPEAQNSTVMSGIEFADADVVRSYVHRTNYPGGLYKRLLDLTKGRHRALDLGCGPGQFARWLAPHFSTILAVDPSLAMLKLAKTIDAGSHPNIEWINTRAEDVLLGDSIDLVVAGASIHWMDPAQIFPKLAEALTDWGIMAIVSGDGPAQSPWIDSWQATIVEWVGHMGGTWNDAAHRSRSTAHEPWFETMGTETFTASVVQSVEDLIDAEHSRATWARSKMGARADEFDADLRAVLAPYAHDGKVEFGVQSSLKWGRPNSQSR
jgi:SAM-dependent methyltransferase